MDDPDPDPRKTWLFNRWFEQNLVAVLSGIPTDVMSIEVRTNLIKDIRAMWETIYEPRRPKDLPKRKRVMSIKWPETEDFRVFMQTPGVRNRVLELNVPIMRQVKAAIKTAIMYGLKKQRN